MMVLGKRKHILFWFLLLALLFIASSVMPVYAGLLQESSRSGRRLAGNWRRSGKIFAPAGPGAGSKTGTQRTGPQPGGPKGGAKPALREIARTEEEIAQTEAELEEAEERLERQDNLLKRRCGPSTSGDPLHTMKFS